MVTGQKVRWVLDLIRGTEFAGPQHHVVRGHRARRERARDRPAGGRARRRAPRSLRAARAAPRARRARATPCACGSSQRRCAACCSTPARSTGFGWSCFTSVDGDATGAPRSGHRGRRPMLANEHLARRGRRDHGTYAIDTDGGLRVAGLGRLVDGGDGGDTYNYSPPAADRVVDRPDAVRVDDARARPGARPRADRRRLHVADARDRRRTRSCTRAQRRDRAP